MSDTLLFVDQAAGDSAEGSLVHVDNQSSEEHLFGANSGNSSNTTEAQKITALQSGNDWYKDDLSHMTTNLMNAEMNTTALTPTARIADIDYAGSISHYSPGDTDDHGASADIKIFNQQQHVYKVVALGLKPIYQDILGRDPNHSEVLSVSDGRPEMSSVYYNNAMQAERNRIAYSQEVYDEIHDNVNRILGYDWGNDNNVRWAQGCLANGESMKGVLDSIAYGDETYSSIRDNANRIFGYDWGNDNNVRWVQDRLAGGESLKGILDSFAYGEETYDHIRDDISRIKGYAWDNADNIRGQQDRLARGESRNDINRSFAYDQETHDIIKNKISNILGYSANEDLVNAMQDKLANNYAYHSDILNEIAYSQEVYNSIANIYSNMIGRPTENIPDNVAWDKDFINGYINCLATNSWWNHDRIRSDMAHSDRVVGVLKDRYTQLKGHSFDANNSNDANWLSWAQQQLINGTNVNSLS